MTEQTARVGRWGQDRRLEFIDFRLLWEGRVNRSDLTSFFRISVPQASLDLAKYSELAPENLVYDRTLKSYVASKDFQPVFANKDGAQYLNELQWKELGSGRESESFIGWAPPVANLPFPTRKINPDVLIALIRAIQKKQAVVVDYRSMENFEEPTTRILFPTSFANDGFRWHLRAYCFNSLKFKDFVLGRINVVVTEIAPPLPTPEDKEWNTFVDVVIGPNPNYPEKKKMVIEHDYQMHNGEARLRTRLAQLYYLKRRLNLNQQEHLSIDENQQIVLLREEIVDSSEADA